jgi:hypothetical protein
MIKKDIIRCINDGCCFGDIGDLLLIEMGEVLREINGVLGTDKPVIDLENGISITIDEQDPKQLWRDRLCMILDMTKDITDKNNIKNIDNVCRKILFADGWRWNRYSFKTPIWINDFDEIDLDDIISQYGMLKCLEVYL